MKAASARVAEADRFIEQGNVFINGKRATIGDQVKPGDLVKVNGRLIEPREADDLVLIALNKPVGIVSTTEDGERDNIVDFVNHSKRIFPIGRLDKDSQGADLPHQPWRSGGTRSCAPATTMKRVSGDGR